MYNLPTPNGSLLTVKILVLLNQYNLTTRNKFININNTAISHLLTFFVNFSNLTAFHGLMGWQVSTCFTHHNLSRCRTSDLYWLPTVSWHPADIMLFWKLCSSEVHILRHNLSIFPCNNGNVLALCECPCLFFLQLKSAFNQHHTISLSEIKTPL